jgi:hypothetical protein
MCLRPAILHNAGEPLARKLCQSRLARSAARVVGSAVSTSTSSFAAVMVPLELSRRKVRSLEDLPGEIVDDCARWLDELIEVDNANPSKRISVDFFALGRILFLGV